MQEYRAATFVVRYDPDICTHAANCVRHLPSVFDVGRSPWVSVEAATPEQIARQVAACPSGALSFEQLPPEGQ